MMKIALLALSLASVPAFAHWGHHHGRDYGRRFYYGNERSIGPARGYYNLYSRGASCDGARSMIDSRGAVIVYFGDGLYDRVVRDGSFCARDQYTKPFWSPSGCFLGYTCQEIDGD